MPIYRFANGQLYKLVFCRITKINGKAVNPDKETVIKMWIPVESRE